MKDWINIGALAVVGVTAITSIGALAYGVPVASVTAISSVVIAGCFAIVNRGGSVQ